VRGGAPNLTADETNGVNEVYIRDVGAQTTALVSRASGPDGAPANGRSYGAHLAAGGRLIFFTSESTNLAPDDQNGVFLRELAPPAF